MKSRKIPGTKYIYAPGSSPDNPPPGQYGDIKLISGSTYVPFGQEVSDYLNIPLCEHEVIKFSNENIFVRLMQSVRGQDVYYIMGMSAPVSDSIMEMLITLDALKRDSAGRINVVIPYFSYGRSDKKDQPRVPITARLLADMIQVAGADRYMAIDLHAPQIQGFFSIPGDALTAFHLISDYFAEKRLEDGVVLSTDLGFAKRGRNYAARLDMPLAVVEKRRIGNRDQAEVMSLIGEVAGKAAIVIDDECDTGGTLSNAVQVALDNGAREVYVAFTHAVMSGPAIERLTALPIQEIVTTNTLPIPAAKIEKLPNLTILSVAPLIAEVIKRAHEGRSVGELFNE
ncbi:MAG: ribose-phosphate diphosphokinase [Anaerolineales bacterium]|nr:ribose-phosphate diphosphokinase [Anaerolineales bacterium]